MLQKLFQTRIVSELVLISAAVFFVLSANFIAAQETFAPLISDKCIAFIHVDFHKLELDRLKSHYIKLAESFFKDLKFDDKSLKSTIDELDSELTNFNKFVRPVFDRITKELGIRELAIIIDPSLCGGRNFQPLFAIRWKNKTEKNLTTLLELLNWSVEVPISYFQASGFLIFYMQVENIHSDQSNKKIAERVMNIKLSKDFPINQVLKEMKGDEIKIAFTISEQLRKELKTMPLNETVLPKPIQNMITFAINKIDWISMSVSLGRFVSESKIESFQFTIKTPKEKDAIFLRNVLEGLIDNAIFLLKTTAAAKAAEAADSNVDFSVPIMLSCEFIGGLLRSNLPVVKGDRLVLSADINVKNVNNFVATVGFTSGLLLPAIQAARASARRMQGANNMRSIILAFHKYHDTYNKLPPIYTVDKTTGKPLHSWRVLILPFLGQVDLYSKIRLNEPWDSEYNKQFHKVIVPPYLCLNTKSKDLNKRCNYVRIEGQLPNTGGSFSDILDGISNTIAVIEVKEPFCWMDPKANITLQDLMKGINNKDGVVGNGLDIDTNCGFWDGSTRWLPNDTPPELLKAIGTANGGESITLP
ncbi:MAG: DUF1559 domain-containing protein [Planctomycetaceae bacterium]|jgi:hypothetical protein|nr:DUF1559 domain-containing protein [Planctomycetaceae bacterium]